jgi:hypothetical protein
MMFKLLDMLLFLIVLNVFIQDLLFQLKIRL